MKAQKMNRIASTLFAAAISLTALQPLAAQADFGQFSRVLGGVDLTRYCRAIFGAVFKAVSIGPRSTDWTCERSAGDRRPISVQKACEMQYGERPIKSIVLTANGPGDWRCATTRQQPPKGKILGGVNLTSYCRAIFGQEFKAVAIGPGAGDWTCEESPGNRRPISVQKACEMQYQHRPIKAVALDQADAGSWRCRG